MQKFTVFISGLLFGAGLTLSGMVNPMKVLNFLDITGDWDPTLLFVMAGGLVTTLIGYQLMFRRGRPLAAERFELPMSKSLDAPLITGAALFGVGWGIAGFCPGPAVASIVFGRAETLIFVACMAAGMLAVKLARGALKSDAQPSA
jgi:uncharacterized protein